MTKRRRITLGGYVYHASHGTVGMGHLYQGRCKSFPVQDDAHYLTVLRYIEANPLRAGLVEMAGIIRSLKRGTPLGDRLWTQATAAKFHLEPTLRPRGRPRKTAVRHGTKAL